MSAHGADGVDGKGFWPFKKTRRNGEPRRRDVLWTQSIVSNAFWRLRATAVVVLAFLFFERRTSGVVASRSGLMIFGISAALLPP